MTYTPTEYVLRVLDTNANMTAVLDDYRSLSLYKEINKVPTATVVIDGKSSKIANFGLDYILEARRNVGAGWYTEWDGVALDINPHADTAEGDSSYTRNFYGWKELLARRFITYYAQSSYTLKSGAGETVIKEFVDENAGPSATSPPRLKKSGVITGLTIHDDGGTGTTWNGQDKSFQALLPTIQEVAAKTGLAFDIIRTGTNLVFRTYDQFGVDRTETGLNASTGLNAAGNAPVIFSLGRGNMLSPSYTYKVAGSANTIFVIGKGIKNEQEVELVENADDSALSKWNQRESVLRGKTDSGTTEMQQSGSVELEKRKIREILTFEVVQQEESRYGRDYFVGDTVTAYWRNNVSFDKIILGVRIAVDASGERVSLILGDVRGR